MTRIFQVDAFTSQPFQGNPAAVCLLDAPAGEKWMQSVAAEMNLSETAFLHPEADGFRLRWFTPRKEVRLCGHATLASAHALWASGMLDHAAEARFDTLSGRLTARRSGGWITLNFPTRRNDPTGAPEGLLDALGLGSAAAVCHHEQIYLIELESEAAVRGLRPDFSRLAGLPVRGVTVTARAESQPYDFVSRYFAPMIGINEDPVTGSAHCALTPYWAAKLGKQEMLAYQASERGGTLRVCLAGDRVLIAGQAVTVLEGQLSGGPTP